MSGDPRHPLIAARTAVVWDALRSALAELADPPAGVTVLDLGGGTGGFAVPVAQLGHRVTVVDPSPDSLAALDRRAAEAGTTSIRALQGDATELVELLGPASIDLVLCHSLLDVVDDPAAAVAAVAAVLRPGGLVSVLAANRIAGVVARVAAGRLREARALVEQASGGRRPDDDPLARRFTPAELDHLVTSAGLRLRVMHGVRVFTDVAPAAVVDADPDVAADLIALERAAADDPAYTPVAAALHVLAERP